MEYDYLTDTALRTMWCAPDQDYQAIIEPKRITPSYGVRKSVKLLWHSVPLPNNTDVFHVFQVGQLNPRLLGLFPSVNRWRTFGRNMVAMNMLINAYNDKGIQLLRSACWYMVTEDKNLVIAIRKPDRVVIDPGVERIYLRVYSNAFFNSVRNNNAQAIHWNGRIVLSEQDILDLQTEIINLETTDGYTTCFVNGRVVRSLNLITASLGDEIEYVHDTSIITEVFLTLSQLRRYTSELDDVGKYILSYAPRPGDPLVTRYHDDVDYYLFSDTGPNEYDGVYIHKNDPKTVRMITFRDYGLAINTVSAIAQNQGWVDDTHIKIRMSIRESGLYQELPFEHHRQWELYKLTQEQRERALSGIDATVSVWQASALEQSPYAQLMRHRSMRLPKALVDAAFGYNAATHATALTPIKVRNLNGEPGIVMPQHLLTNVTAFEHDVNGKLLGTHIHLEGLHYLTRNAQTRLVDVVKGLGGINLTDTYNQRTEVYNPNLDYRFYVCDVYDGVARNNWRDVTGTGHYAITGGNIRWIDDPNIYTLTRKSDSFLTYSMNITPLSGVMRFSLRNRIYRDQQTVEQVMQVPMGELDVYLNGHPLIEGIDFKLNFPEVVIYSKRFIKEPWTGPQTVHIRYTGFHNENPEHEPAREIGFIKHGLASTNRVFNVRDDKVIRTIIDGKLVHREDLTFAEDGEPMLGVNSLNGKPYSVRDIVTPIRPIADRETYEFLAASRAVDEEIENYLTLKHPEPIGQGPNPINEKYPLYSPFLTAIIMDLINGYLEPSYLFDPYNDQQVVQTVQPYEFLLTYDPTQDRVPTDYRFVEVHPTPSNSLINLPMQHYRFVQQVVRLYCNDRVILNHFLAIQTF